MNQTPTHYTISVPRFAGYKTVIINTAVILWGIAAVAIPKLRGTSLDADQLGLVLDSAQGAAVAVVGLINLVLRFLTTTPVAPLLPRPKPVDETPVFVAHPQQQPQSRHMAGIQHAFERHVDDGWCEDLMPSFLYDAEPYPQDAAVKPSFTESVRRHPGRMARAFLVPFLMVPFFAFAVAPMGGCAAVQQVNAIQQAETLEQRAFALYGTFTVAEERVLAVIQDRRVPVETRRRLQQLDRITKPTADLAVETARKLQEARKAYQAGDGTLQAVTALTASLQGAVATLAPRVTAMVNAVNLAREKGNVL